MRAANLLIVVGAIVLITAASSSAQVTNQITPEAAQQAGQPNSGNDDDELINAVFDPLTADLKLTPAQRFRILAIATETTAKAERLFEQLDKLDDQLSVAAFTGQLDETKIKEAAAKQGALLSEIIAMKARAKTNFYRVLTDDQRAMILDQFRRSNVQNLGAIIN
jgi:Spy/CpxP family protein refolding chaperone